MSHAFWMRRFGGDPSVVNRPITLNGSPFTVAGVIAPSYSGAIRGTSVDLWIPLHAAQVFRPAGRSDPLVNRGSRGLFLLGRLRPGTSMSTAQAAFDVVAAQLYAAYPQQWRTIRNEGRRISVVSESGSRVHPDLATPVGGFMALLMIVVGLVLLTACANVANLLLARGTARGREISVRLALGASRGRLVRQFLTESLLLAMAGGLFGVLTARWVIRLLESFRPPIPIRLAFDFGLDASVLAFAAVLMLVTGVVFGLAPALHASGTNVVSSLKDEAAGGRVRRSRLRSAFVVVQLACSTLLVIGAGLFLRSLQNARAIDVGFDPSNMVVMSLNPGLHGYDEARSRAVYEQTLQRVSAMPGVRSATLAASLPLGFGGSRRGTIIEGYKPQPGEDTETSFNVVGPSYFETMRVPILRGRTITDRDRPGAPLVVVVNEAFARRYWPGQEALGKRISISGPGGPFREVVGVAQTGKYNTLGEDPRPFYYVPLWQDFRNEATLQVKLGGDPQSMIGPIRDVIRAVDPALPVFQAQTMDDQMSVAMLPARIAGYLLSAFGALALLLASVGIYGVMAYSVEQRTREIGVRMALGARRADVIGLILGNAGRLTGLGLALGCGAALLLTRFVQTLLYGITPTDPMTFAGALLMLSGASLIASYLPAWRATRVNPVSALRHE
jgi:putative ABC transport system permease protein